MAIEPVKSAELIYKEAFGALMAHTVRGMVNHFRKERIELDVRIIPDVRDIINLQAPDRGATSILVTQYFKGNRDGMRDGERDRVDAKIYIHKDANKHLARICIAHEMYHLLLELDAFLAVERKQWKGVTHSKRIEDECNQFAWQLCAMHDKFNRNEADRKQHVLFPEKLFEQPLKTNDATHHLEWPEGIKLDPEDRFWRAG